MKLNVIMPDTNVILAASINDYYEEIEYKLCMQHEFHNESSQLFHIIRDKEKYPNVKGVLLKKVEHECANTLYGVLQDMCEKTTVEYATKKVVGEIIKRLEEDIETNKSEIKVLKKVYSKIANITKNMNTMKSNSNESMNFEKAVEHTWKKAMYNVVYDKLTIDPNLSKLDILWHEIDKEATKCKNWNLHKLCDINAGKTIIRCGDVMNQLLDTLDKSRLICDVVSVNLKVVNDWLEKIITKNKNSKQVIAHKKSKKRGHSHDHDILILTQAATHKTLVDDPKSEIYILNCKIYIASYDKKFFSPYKGDSTITDAIWIKFKIICNTPEKILGIVQQNSKDGP